MGSMNSMSPAPQHGIGQEQDSQAPTKHVDDRLDAAKVMLDEEEEAELFPAGEWQRNYSAPKTFWRGAYGQQGPKAHPSVMAPEPQATTDAQNMDSTKEVISSITAYNGHDICCVGFIHGIVILACPHR